MYGRQRSREMNAGVCVGISRDTRNEERRHPEVSGQRESHKVCTYYTGGLNGREYSCWSHSLCMMHYLQMSRYLNMPLGKLRYVQGPGSSHVKIPCQTS